MSRHPWISQNVVNRAARSLHAGATAVGVGTALFYDPLVCPKINKGLAEYLAARGLASIGQLAVAS